MIIGVSLVVTLEEERAEGVFQDFDMERTDFEE